MSEIMKRAEGVKETSNKEKTKKGPHLLDAKDKL